MQRVLLKIAYDGTAYHGWQVQPNAVTVQEVLGDALSKMLKTKTNITGCSRTDAGVHANEFYCHFDSMCNIPFDAYVKGLNALLPKDISVYSAESVSSDFHARYNAKSKNYIYKILNTQVRDPFLKNYTYYHRDSIDIDKINDFCQKIIGTHDFTAFSSSGRTTTDTVRTISDCKITENGDILTFSITANGFLYNMVRIIVGTALEVSEGRIENDDIMNIINSKNRSLAGPTVPPNGLYLNKVYY